MNNKNLLIIFAALLGIYGLTKVFSGKKDRSFDTNLITVDTAAVTQIVIDPKAPEEQEITLKKEATGWIASNGTLNVKATQTSVNTILGNLLLIKTKRIAAKKPEKWKDYEVTDSLGTRVQVYEKGKLAEDFIVGRFSFNQQARSGISFIRLNGENEVYAIDGFQTLTFGQGFNSYRDKSILQLKPEMEITEFSYERSDSAALNFLKVDGQWQINGNPLDSAKVASYLNGIRTISGTDFADDFDEIQADNYRYKTLTIKGNNILDPLVVQAFQDTTKEKPFIIRSSQNQEAYFASDSTGVVQQLFKNVGELQ